MSDTPRTDAVLQEIREGKTPSGCIPKSYAKELELELAEIKKILKDPLAVWVNMLRGTIARPAALINRDPALALLKDSAVLAEAASTCAVQYLNYNEQAKKHIKEIESFLKQVA